MRWKKRLQRARTPSEPPASSRALAGHRSHRAVLHRSGRRGLRAGVCFSPSSAPASIGSKSRFRWCRFRTPSARCRCTRFTPSCAWPSPTFSAWPSPSPTATSPPTIRASSRGWSRCSTFCSRFPCSAFLPPVVLAMVSLVPGHQLGIEMAVILLIFTGQVWNLAFSFYSSLKTIPREMLEASRIYRYSGWQRFWQLEMPYSAIGLVWNSIVSVAGGWFALIFCETFTMGDRNFQLPGLGSYIQTATYAGDVRALLAGIAAVILIVVATDQLVWRPLIAWSDKFKFEQVEVGRAGHFADPRAAAPIEDSRHSSRPHLESRRGADLPAHGAEQRSAAWCGRSMSERRGKARRLSGRWRCAAAWPFAGRPRRPCSCSAPSPGPTCACLLEGAAATFLRVNAALLISAAWTIPVGVAIGLNPRLARIVQPLAQIMASVPATAFFPDPAHRAGQDRRRTGHRLHRADAAGHAVVHPLQRDRRRHVHPLGPARGRLALPLHALAAMDQADPARNFSLSDHRDGHGLRRRVERVGHGRVFAREGPDARRPSAWARRSTPPPTAGVSPCCCWRRS